MLKKHFLLQTRWLVTIILLLSLCVGNAWGADSGLTASPGVFIFDFYNSEKRTTTSGTNLNTTNCREHVKVPTGISTSDVISSVSITNNVRYDMNGGLTLGKGSNQDSHADISIGSNFPIRKITVVGTLYGTDAAPLYVAGTSITLNAKQSTYASCSSSTTITPTPYITTININNNNKKRSTLYTAVCEYGYRAYLTTPAEGAIAATPKTANENGAGWNSDTVAVVGLKSGQKVTLSVTSSPSGKVFSSWTIKKKSDNTDITASVLAGNELTMPAYDVKVSVNWASSGTSVSLTKAGETNGTFSLSTSSVTTTSSAQTVTVTCSPNAGYYVSAISATNPATCPSAITYGGSNNSRTVTYPTGANGSSTISVTFSPIWYLKGSFNTWGETNPCTVADGIATATVSLAKNTKYEFQFYDKQNSTWYYNGGNIVEDISGWTFTGGTGSNCKIFTGKAGTYTFKINTSTKAVQVIYQSPSHPDDAYVYFKKWADWSDNYFVHWWDGSGNTVQDYNSAIRVTKTYSTCDNDYVCFPILADYTNFLVKDAASGDGSHKSGDLTSNSNAAKYYDFESWKNFTTYEINFGGNGNTGGEMSSITDLCPGAEQALTSNAFTKTHYSFSCWHADVAVKVGESTISAGGDISNGATIKDIQSDINLTAQWSPVSYTITKTFTNVANAGLPASFTYTGSATTALNSTFTVDATNFFLPSSIAVTMGGTPLTAGSDYTYNNSTGAFTFSAVITGNIVITASATAKLKSIAITSQPTTRKYLVGDVFSSTGAVVTATMGDGSTKAVTASATWTPAGALSAGTSQTVTATYTEAGIEKTATTTIDVYSVTVNKVDMDGNAIADAGVTASCSGRTLSQSVSTTNYKFNSWVLATASGTSLSTNTLTGTPTGNVVVNAKFHKPITVTWKVGSGAASGSPTTEVKYNTAITALPSTPADNALASCGTNKFMGWSAAGELKGTGHDAPADLFTTVGGATALTENTTYRAVFANVVGASGYEYIGDAGLLEEDETYIFVSSKSTGSAYALKSSDLPNNNTAGVKGTAVSVTVAKGIKIATTNTDLEFTCSSHNSESEEDVLVIGSTANTLRINGNGIGYGTARAYYDNTGLWGWNNSVNKFYDVYYNSTSEKFEAKESADTRVYAYKKLTSTTSDYQTGCCEAPGTALSITSANSVATGGTVSLTSTGGNGGTVTWSVVNGTGTATVAGSTLTAGSIGTVTVKAHQDANTVLGTEYCAQDAEQAFTVVSSTINVTGVEVSPTTKAIVPGETFDITPTISPSNATDKSVSWTSSASDKASVSSGTVTGVAAGTATITCTTTDGSYTATCAVTVYSASVTSIVDEDGTDISASGVTATISGRTLTASEGSTNYKFKTWKYGTASGTSISSATSLSTSLTGTPNGNVTLIAEFYKPVEVAWTKGGTTYSTGGPTTSVKRGTQWKDLTIPTAPGDATLGACANKFMGWSNCSDLIGTGHSAPGVLFTSVSGITTEITEDIEFKAVFATEESGTWTLDYSEEDDLQSSTSWSYGTGLSYTASDGGTWVVKANKNSGMQINAGKNSSIKIPDCSGNITSIVVTGTAKTVRFSQSDYDGSSFGVIEVTGSDANNQTLDFAGKSLTAGYIVPYTNANQITKIVVNYGSTSDYVTQCDPNQVRVTYDANGGSTTCAGGSHDKRNDYTVCSSAPTKDYYSFAGWLCSADDEVYAASATIDDAVIDADFSLTAQWTPVNYTITYNLHGGTTAGGNPTTYDVETATIDLADGTYGHNRFEGWYNTYNEGTGAYSGQVTNIPLGSHGDITLHAKWTTRHEIVFDADGETTTIYRADDEAMDASVAGQGSVPSDPSAPTNCSTKVFVGWSESEIDDETNTRPSDLMKPAEGKVDEDKHYYAVWALRAGSPAPATYAGTGTFVKITSMSEVETDTYYVLRGIKDASTIKVMKNTISSSKMGTADDPVSENVITNPGVAIVWKLGGKKDAYTLYNQSVSKYVEITANSTGGYALNSSATTSYTLTIEEGHGFFFKSNYSTANSRGISIYDASEFRSYGLANAKTLELYKLPAYTYSAYSTSCCETKVNLTHNSPEHGTVEFSKSRIGTCNSDKEVSLTITPDAGYKLTGWTVNTTSGYADAKTTSPAVVTTNNNSATQNITLTFAQDANKNYDVSATFGLMTVESWAWTYNSAAMPNPLNLYIGQSARLDVAYTPAGVDNSKKTYTRTKEDAYINWIGVAQSTYTTISGRASTGENTTPVTFIHGDGPTTIVNVKVLPLPAVHFGDIVHNVEFADVVATLSDNTLSPTKTTPTHADFDGATKNTCEEEHLHLVGWIREDWPSLVTYLNGGAKPSTDDITGAGNDGSGNAYFFTPGASINTQTFNGVTFYAVWAKVE